MTYYNSDWKMTMADAQTYADYGYYTTVLNIVPNTDPVVWFNMLPQQVTTCNIVENYGIYATKQTQQTNVSITKYSSITCLLNTCWIWNGTSFSQDNVTTPVSGGVIIKNATPDIWVFGLLKQSGDSMNPICKVDVFNNLSCSMVPQEVVSVSIGKNGKVGTVIYNVYNYVQFTLPQSPDPDTVTGHYSIALETGNVWNQTS